MKRMIWLLMLVFCMQTAFAESAPADGLYTVGVSSNAKMFKIMDCILRVEDGKMTAVLTMSGSGYGYLYQGTSAEADAAPMESWTPYFENADGKHRFAIEIPVLDEEIPMASWSIRYEKWYDRSLQFFSDTLTPYREIAPDGVYSAKIISDTGLNGATAILYSKDGEMTLETDNLSMELLSLDTRIPIEGGWIKVESFHLMPYRVTALDGVYSAQVQTDSNLLRFTGCRLTIVNGEITALLTAKNNNFDYIYLGPAADANTDPNGWIRAEQNADGAYTYTIPAKHGGIWYDSTIENILRNEKYQGDLLLQKQFRLDHLSKKDCPNHGELPQYFVEGNHEAIISREDFAAAQARIARQAEHYDTSSTESGNYPFTGKLICGGCGKTYRRRQNHGKNVWQCTTYMTRGKKYCPAKQIHESVLENISADVLGAGSLNTDDFHNQIESIRIFGDHRLVFRFYDCHEEERFWQNPSRRESWTPEMKQQAAMHAGKRYNHE